MFAMALTGAATVALAVAVAWHAVSSGRGTATVVASNLRNGTTTDLRAAVLDRSARDRVVEPSLERLTQRLRRLTPVGVVEGLERRILLAGASATWTVERALAAKVVGAGAGTVVGVCLFSALPAPFNWVGLLLPSVSGFFLPEILLSGRAQERQAALSLELPDSIDQLTVSVSAGLGLEAAMARVARTGTGPLADELTRTLQDTRAGMSRAAALRALIDRTEVPELRTVVMALLQAEGYGVPISQVLRVQSAELRMKRRQRAEERAMKLPVKVLFPLVTCILPTIFIVLLGPAGIRIVHMFQHLR